MLFMWSYSFNDSAWRAAISDYNYGFVFFFSFQFSLFASCILKHNKLVHEHSILYCINELVPLLLWIVTFCPWSIHCSELFLSSNNIATQAFMILVFWMLSFKPAFLFSSFTFIKRLCSSCSLVIGKYIHCWSNQ